MLTKTRLPVAILRLLLTIALCTGPVVAGAAETASSTVDRDQQRAAAAQQLKTAEQNHGQDSPELIPGLLGVAFARIELMDWDNAIANTTRALDILDNTPDRESEILARMLRSRANAGAGNYAAAKQDALRAIKLNKKVKPVDLHQEAVLYARLLDIAVRELDLNGGNHYAAKMLKADRKHFGKSDAGLVPTLLRSAGWYRFSSQFSRERKLLKQAIALLETAHGKNDSRLAGPLRRISQSYVFHRKKSEEAEMVLRRAMNLDFGIDREAAANKAAITAELADYIVVLGNPETATSLYEDAWELIADDAGAVAANRNYSRVKKLYFLAPGFPGEDRSLAFFVEGFVQVEFTVTPLGTVEDVIVLDYQPREINQSKFIRAYRKARYRPRVVDGKAVATSNIRHRSSYSYSNR